MDFFSTFDRRRDRTIRLVDTARPASPSDQGRQEYRRAGGYDKQGEVGAGTATPQFVRSRSRRRDDICFLSFLRFSAVVMDCLLYTSPSPRD